MANYKIMIISNNLDEYDYIKKFLEENLTCDIIYNLNANNLIELIDNKENAKIDLMIIRFSLVKKFITELLVKIRENYFYKYTPIIFILDNNEFENKEIFYNFNDIDYVTLPLNNKEIKYRIEHNLKFNFSKENVSEYIQSFIDLKTKSIENIAISIAGILESGNLFNDKATINHLKRMSEYSALIAEKYGCDKEFIDKIKLYAPFHDIGKISINENILKKASQLTKEEYEIVKQHVVIGSQMLKSDEIDVMARNIALYHHEKWDGTGYLYNLKGEEIPLEARIVAICDVYDALVRDRIYKSAFSEAEANLIILEEQGYHFEPKIVDIFLANKNKIIEIKNSFM